MNGTKLTLGVVGLLAGASLLKRGSRAWEGNTFRSENPRLDWFDRLELYDGDGRFIDAHDKDGIIGSDASEKAANAWIRSHDPKQGWVLRVMREREHGTMSDKWFTRKWGGERNMWDDDLFEDNVVVLESTIGGPVAKIEEREWARKARIRREKKRSREIARRGW